MRKSANNENGAFRRGNPESDGGSVDSSARNLPSVASRADVAKRRETFRTLANVVRFDSFKFPRVNGRPGKKSWLLFLTPDTRTGVSSNRSADS